MGESRESSSTIQAAVPRHRKYAGRKNEGLIHQHVPPSKINNAVISETVEKNETVNNNLRIASLNIDRGLFDKEERLINTIEELELDIFGVSEVDIKDFDETKQYSLQGFNTFFPL